MLLAALGQSHPASATTLAVRFDGVLTAVTALNDNLDPVVLDPALVTGRPLSGLLTYSMDPVASIGIPGLTELYFEGIGLTGSIAVDFGDGLTVAMKLQRVTVENDNGPWDAFSAASDTLVEENIVLSAPGPDAHTRTFVDAYLGLTDLDRSVFTNTTLLDTAALLGAFGDFENRLFSLTFTAEMDREFPCDSPEGICFDRGVSSTQLNGTITRLQPVPGPPALGLMATGLGALLFYRRTMTRKASARDSGSCSAPGVPGALTCEAASRAAMGCAACRADGIA